MILLDYKDRRPLYEQIVERFQELMFRGVLKAEDPMPSVRTMATELSINPNTIQRSYAQLERQGFIYTVKGRGSFVSDVSAIQDMKKQAVIRELGLLVKEAMDVGIDRDRCISYVNMIYEKGGIKDDRGSEPNETV